MSHPFPLALIASMDAQIRDITTLSMACDLRDSVEIRHERHAVDDDVRLRCVVSDFSGLVHEQWFDIEHDCLSCSVREGIVPTLQWVLDQGRWNAAIVVLPVTAPPETVAWELNRACAENELPGAGLAQVIAVIDPGTFRDDLLGDDLLAERQLAISPWDQRAVGEALASQIEYADIVCTLEVPDEATHALLCHVLPPDTSMVTHLDDLDISACLTKQHQGLAATRRVSPASREQRTVSDTDHIWSLELHSDKPFHPGRLLEQIELLGAGRLRARGCFWLPSRPSSLLAWEGAGGQLSIGDVGLWGALRPRTHVIITGDVAADRERVLRAFQDVLLTDFEFRAGLSSWVGIDDGMDQWLGSHDIEQAG